MSARTPYDSTTSAEDLHLLIGHLGVGPVHLTGQDISGATVFRLATTHPQDVLSLTRPSDLRTSGQQQPPPPAHHGDKPLPPAPCPLPGDLPTDLLGQGERRFVLGPVSTGSAISRPASPKDLLHRLPRDQQPRQPRQRSLLTLQPRSGHLDSVRSEEKVVALGAIPPTPG
jgi:pimeloyl-ACP methyl ester carboxylesterase